MNTKKKETNKRKRQKEERTSVLRPLSWNIYAKKQCRHINRALIDCLRSSKQYFSHIQNEKSLETKNKKEGTMGWVNMGNDLTRELVFLFLPTIRWSYFYSPVFRRVTLLLSPSTTSAYIKKSYDWSNCP